MTATLYRTHDMHSENHAPLTGFDWTMVTCAYRIDRPIRFQARRIQHLDPLRTDRKGFARISAKWQDEGGILVYQGRPSCDITIPPHDAMLIAECPMSLSDLEKWTKETTDAVCVYAPPHWVRHRTWVMSRYPNAKDAEAWYKKLEDRKTYSLADHTPHMRHTLNLTGRYEIVYVIRPRIAPAKGALLELWDAIMACPEINGHRCMREPDFRQLRGLTKLHRDGNIVREATCTYYLEGFRPDYDGIQRRHFKANDALSEIIEKVEAAPEYDLQTL